MLQSLMTLLNKNKALQEEQEDWRSGLFQYLMEMKRKGHDIQDLQRKVFEVNRKAPSSVRREHDSFALARKLISGALY